MNQQNIVFFYFFVIGEFVFISSLINGILWMRDNAYNSINLEHINGKMKKEAHPELEEMNKYLKRMALHVLLQVSWFFETCTTFCAGIGLLSLCFPIAINSLPLHLLLNSVKNSKVNPKISGEIILQNPKFSLKIFTKAILVFVNNFAIKKIQ